MALQVDAYHGVEVGFVHLEAHPVAQEAGIVDDDVEIAERVDRPLDQRTGTVPGGDVVPVGDGGAPGGGDLVDDGLRDRTVGPATVGRGPEVVDHDPGALGSEEHRLAPADAPSRPGDDGDLAVQVSHPVLLVVRRSGPRV